MHHLLRCNLDLITVELVFYLRHIFKITAMMFRVYVQLVFVYIEVVVAGVGMQNFAVAWSLDFGLSNVDSFFVKNGSADKFLVDIAFVDYSYLSLHYFRHIHKILTGFVQAGLLVWDNQYLFLEYRYCKVANYIGC